VRVLIAEDEPISRLVLRKHVESLGHLAIPAADGIVGWEQYQRALPDVIISDWMMPGIEGIEFCRRVRAVETSTYTYFIFMTALGDKQHFMRGMEAGADDYLTKPVDRDELEARLYAAARVTSLHRRLLQQNAELERLGKASFEAARVDPLTLVPNRLRMREDLEALNARVTRYGQRFSVALLDVDHFKKYNDHHGHQAGDEVLRAVARAVAGALRAGDNVYRYGGEEFFVLLPEQDEAGARVAIDRVRAGVESLALRHEGLATAGVVTASCGVAALGEGDTPPWDALIKRADAALYRAKAAGRNRVVCASEVPVG
jgi:diguanylate cyclase (GGDEF)-like protein